MFDIGFGELLIIAIVALVVLGPERLPKAARFAGLWVRRARAQWHSVRDELERELAADELKRSLHDTEEAMRETERRIRDTAAQTAREFEDVRQSVQDTGTSAKAASAPEPPIEQMETSLASSRDPDALSHAQAADESADEAETPPRPDDAHEPRNV
ncbi:MAG TPA: Sec-independent protein translocase protein TatB [Pseudoxanthomonas sp.]|jgi:sec-independent protein translocase protein TatB|nr:Sec-independent protein translocase protein TatB [Pseudoxanthomonas sp.]